MGYPNPYQQLSIVSNMTSNDLSVDPMLMAPVNMSTNMNVGPVIPVDPRILGPNVDLTNMQPTSMIGTSDQNAYQSGAVGAQFSNAQQQPPSLYHQNTQANYIHNGFPISSTSGYYNTVNTSSNGDTAAYHQDRPRSRIVRNLGMPEDPFITDSTSNSQQVAIPRLFQSGKRVSFAVPEGYYRSNLPAETPSKSRPSRTETQAKLRKGVRRSAVAATAAATAARTSRAQRVLAPRPTTEVQETKTEAKPKQRQNAVKRLSERWQSALRSRSSASTSDAAAETEGPDGKT
jgi:hypothetical protein